eukprot:TRINITY_DN91450_c0_g1_i1.p1 TRINITY_DN91450_c0_g1~~TRINITY_DN91450_c0_g1_i1.p1  ORF type:complete len:171 (+),score=38.01 TRINITY_DN91450_c0_g1_i1:120-632(+)
MKEKEVSVSSATPRDKKKNPQKKTVARVVDDFAEFTSVEPATCKQVLAHAGSLLAVPFSARSRKAAKPANDVLESVAQHDFQSPRTVSCSTEQKPLEPYKQYAGRNRLVLPTPPPPASNRSQIDWGAGVDDPRRFVTSNRNDYRGIHGHQSSNLSIVAARTRWFHKLQNL